MNNSCLEEINRLHSCFRKNLPLYEISVDKKQPVKCQLLDVCDEDTPAKKKPKRETLSKAKKRPSDTLKPIHNTKKAKVASSDKDCEVVAVDT